MESEDEEGEGEYDVDDDDSSWASSCEGTTHKPPPYLSKQSSLYLLGKLRCEK